MCVYDSETDRERELERTRRGGEEEGDNKAMTLYVVWQQSSAHKLCAC